MSVSLQPTESNNRKPSLSEISELLINLGLSPPQSLDENLLPTSPISWLTSTSPEFVDHEETETPDYVSDSDVAIKTNFDREGTIAELEIARKDEQIIKWKNDYFHEYLGEHFKRKQMMHVYTEESEDDVLLNEYLQKLDELERCNGELQKSHEEWDAELTRTRENIRRKKEEARLAVDEMIANETTVGTSSWYCGKPLSIRRVQSLIARQLDRIKDIAKFRLRYTQLRDEYIERELELKRIEISSPNLTKEDYERLEAEQFYYKRELTMRNSQCDFFCQKRDRLVPRIKAIHRRIVEITREIDNCEIVIESLKNSVRIALEERKISLAKLADAKRFIREFNDIVGQSERPEFSTRMANIKQEHEEWMRKISGFLRDIKHLGQSLNAVKANLMLHGKVFEQKTGGEEAIYKSEKNSENGKNKPGTS